MNPGTASPPFELSRHFAASAVQLWRAWTEAEQLRQWFSSPGTTLQTCDLVFRPGGHFHYGMRMPDGQTLWGLWTFRVIVPMQSLVLVSQFSDAGRGLTRLPLSASWPLHTLSTTRFSADGAGSRMSVQWTPLDATPEEQASFDAAHASMAAGMGGMLDQLAAYLARPA